MNLVADESIDGSIVDHLRANGHKVVYVAEMSPGIPDDEVLSLARDRQALLLTADKDFGDLVFRQSIPHCGGLLIRLVGLDPEDKAAVVSSVLESHAAEMAARFSVVTPETLRIRQ